MTTWRDVVRDALPTSLTDSVWYDIGAMLGDDARVLKLPLYKTIVYGGLICVYTFALARHLRALRVLGHSARARREVVRVIKAVLDVAIDCRLTDVG